MSSSIFAVAIGSSAEHGSSIKSTSGSTASARAMHRRCCWPPDRLTPDLPRASFTSSHSAACRKARSAASCSTARSRMPPSRRPTTTLSNTDIVGNGFGFWKTMPILRRIWTGSTPGA